MGKRVHVCYDCGREVETPVKLEKKSDETGRYRKLGDICTACARNRILESKTFTRTFHMEWK